MRIAVGVLGAWLSTFLSDPRLHVGPVTGAACGVVFALVGQGGDLIVSLLKRGSGLKDSSGMVPGMGGVLDVLDSVILVGPVAYWMLHPAWRGSI